MDVEITAGAAHVLVFVLAFYSVRIARRTKEIKEATDDIRTSLDEIREELRGS